MKTWRTAISVKAREERDGRWGRLRCRHLQEAGRVHGWLHGLGWTGHRYVVAVQPFDAVVDVVHFYLLYLALARLVDGRQAPLDRRLAARCRTLLLRHHRPRQPREQRLADHFPAENQIPVFQLKRWNSTGERTVRESRLGGGVSVLTLMRCCIMMVRASQSRVHSCSSRLSSARATVDGRKTSMRWLVRHAWSFLVSEDSCRPGEPVAALWFRTSKPCICNRAKLGRFVGCGIKAKSGWREHVRTMCSKSSEVTSLVFQFSFCRMIFSMRSTSDTLHEHPVRSTSSVVVGIVWKRQLSSYFSHAT